MEEQKDTCAMQAEYVRKDREKSIAAAMEAMGWDRERAARELDETRERTGCSSQDYRTMELYRLEPERQKQILRETLAMREAEKDARNAAIRSVIESAHCDRMDAIDQVEAAVRLGGISYAQFNRMGLGALAAEECLRLMEKRKRTLEARSFPILRLRQTIRGMMQATGWDAWRSYQTLLELYAETGLGFGAILEKEAWRAFKYRDALRLIGEGEAEDVTDLELPPQMLYPEFAARFYTKAQQFGIRQVQQGRLTWAGLFQFLNLPLDALGRIPLADAEREENISGKIHYLVNSTRPGDILFLIRRAEPDEIAKHRPAFIVVAPPYEDLVKDLGLPYLVRPHLRSYLFELSFYWRRSQHYKTVTISGSIGKTTTTQMIGMTLSSALNVFRVTGNKNTADQVLQFVFRPDPSTQVFVQECSGAYPGQLDRSSRVMRPDIYVITNIGHGHIGSFDGKQEFLLYEKASMDRNAAPDGVGVVNWDDPMLRKYHYRHKIIKCALYEPDADLTADNIDVRDGTVSFEIVENDEGGRRTPVVLKVSGLHNVYNALSAFAVGRLMDVPREKIVQALESFQTQGIRQNLVWLSGQHVYIDCYSATVESMETAMTVLPTITVPEGKKRIAILADVPSLGEGSEEAHRVIGRMTARLNTADEVFFFGREMVSFAMEEALKGGIRACRGTEDRLELERWMREEFPRAGLFLLKASHKMQLQWVLDDLFGTPFYAYDEANIYAARRSVGSAEFRCIPEYGCLLIDYDRKQRTVTLPETVEGLPVRIIGSYVFAGAQIEEVSLPEGLRSIAENAFAGCTALCRLQLPQSLQYIASGAFKNCTALEELVLPSGCETIESGAFQGCTALKRVILPSTVKTLAEDAFEATTELVYASY